MKDSFSDRMVIIIMIVTILIVFLLIFSTSSNNIRNEDSIQWRESNLPIQKIQELKI